MHSYLLITTWYALTFKLSVEFMRRAFHLWFLLIFYDDVYRWQLSPPYLGSRQFTLISYQLMGGEGKQLLLGLWQLTPRSFDQITTAVTDPLFSQIKSINEVTKGGSQYRKYNLSVICMSKYSRTSMARTSSGPWKFVRDMGSSCHWG